MNACCRRPGRSRVPRPSRVVIWPLPTAETGMTQERIALPSSTTVHAPHCASPHPNFGPYSPRPSRSAYRSMLSGSAETLQSWPFTWSVRLCGMKVSLWSNPEHKIHYCEYSLGADCIRRRRPTLDRSACRSPADDSLLGTPHRTPPVRGARHGCGIAGSKTPKQNLARLKSAGRHSILGLRMSATALVLAREYPEAAASIYRSASGLPGPALGDFRLFPSKGMHGTRPRKSQRMQENCCPRNQQRNRARSDKIEWVEPDVTGKPL